MYWFYQSILTELKNDLVNFVIVSIVYAPKKYRSIWTIYTHSNIVLKTLQSAMTHLKGQKYFFKN